MHPDTLGWAAAALMVATFSCREARHLRPLAVATNLAFVGYGFVAGLMPVLVLHLLLLPINLWRWAQALSRKEVRQVADQFGRLLCVVALSALPLMAGCGGGGGDDGAGTPPPAPPASGAPSATPPTQTPPTIGAVGGTVSTGDGAEVTVPAGALSTEVTIEVHAAPAGAPALPPGWTALSKTYAFTPHGTTFAVPATVTVPFDAALLPAGEAPVLYKADTTGPAAGLWRPLADAVAVGNVMRASIDSFSYAVVGPPALQLTGLSRQWLFEKLLPDGDSESVLPPGRSGWAPVESRLVLSGPYAGGRIWGNATGSQYEVDAIAPERIAGDPRSPVGVRTLFNQRQTFVKAAGDASLDFSITRVLAAASDYDPRPVQCGQAGRACKDLHAELQIEVTAALADTGEVFFHRAGRMYIHGSHDAWRHGVFSSSENKLWEERDFELRGGGFDILMSFVGEQVPGELPRLKVDVPLNGLRVGQRFTLHSRVWAEALDRRQTETEALARFRDPQRLGDGVQVQHQGLLPVGGDERLPQMPPQPPTCASADAEAGTLQFDSAAFTAEEAAVPGTWVTITRSGGTKGRVGATVVTRGGTATPGEDYDAVSTYVGFADGEGGSRIVQIPVRTDPAPEIDETVELELIDPRGCAALGPTSRATLTILDDDSLAVPATYRVGGTVSGLAGTGLVLEDRAQFVDLAVTAIGSFEFDRNYGSGAAYDVRVKVPPSNPSQVCTVSRGSGVVGNASVGDIAVDCVTPPRPTGFDLSFGAGTGKVTSGPAGVVRAVALQPDGRIVAAIGNAVARYFADGLLDTSFGSNGSVAGVLGNSNFNPEINDIAVQPDGRIVVAGATRSSFSTLAYDFGAARLNADGSRDASFNGGNALQIDWIGAPDRATRVLLQPDGRIVLAGTATTVYTPATDDSAMALVRLNADGSLDAGFGSGGRAVVEFAPLDFGLAAVLQPDGKIVVAGRVSDNRGDDPRFGVARFNADGSLDAGFGTGGKVRINELGEAMSMALQPDGRMVFALAQRAPAGSLAFGVVRLNADGSTDTGFGSTGGLALLDVSSGNDAPTAMALQADGRIVVVGSSLNTTTSFDVVVARFLANGTPDTSFGTGGFYSLDFFGGRDGAYDVLVQPDGKLLVAGSAGSGLTTLPMLLRLFP